MIQFGEHCGKRFAISYKRKSVCLSKRCPKGTLNFRSWSCIVSSVELWPLFTLYRQFYLEPFTMSVSWTKAKFWKQEGISSSALAGTLSHRFEVCEYSLSSDCGSRDGTCRPLWLVLSSLLRCGVRQQARCLFLMKWYMRRLVEAGLHLLVQLSTTL